MRTFVFGDIHGSAKELKELLQFIFNAEKFSDTDKILFIGDYVDRGFQSKQVIDQLIKLKEVYPSTVFLRGNHEDMFMDFIGIGGSYGSVFIMNGGTSTLFSYGAPRVGVEMPTLREYQAIADPIERDSLFAKLDTLTLEDMAHLVPDHHRQFLKDTVYYHDTDNVLFVHGGLNPYITLEENTPFDFTWVQDNRARFFSQISHKPWHKMLVHGHTSIDTNDVKKHVHRNRINVDTGFVYGGRLTVLVVDDTLPAEQWKLIQHHGDKITCRV